MPEKLGLSCLFGFGAVTLQMFMMSLLGMRLTRSAILLPWVAVAAVNAIRFFRTPLKSPLRPPARVGSLALIALIALQTCYNFFRALIRPIEAYDAVAIYGLKAKMIYLSGGIGSGFFRSIALNFNGAHADYPLLIPLSKAWAYIFMGSFNDILVKAIFPLFFMSFLFIFYAALKRITQKTFPSVFFTFALASIKQFSDYSTIALADLSLGVYFAISVFYAYFWFRSRNMPFLTVSLISSVLCLWTKNEGSLLVLLVVFILLSYAVANAKSITKREIVPLSLYVLVIFAGFLSWGMFKSGISAVNENFNLSMVNFSNLTANLGKLPAILYEYQKQLFGFKKWNIVWILFIIVLFKEFRRAFSGDTKYVALIPFLFLLGYTFVYIFSAVEIDFFLRKTFSRFLLHILPITVFLIALLVKHET
jgi:hypothetical protein